MEPRLDESEISLAKDHHMLAEAQFNLLKSQSQLSVKEGTSHFQGIALTNSELNNFNTATLGHDQIADNAHEDNKENN